MVLFDTLLHPMAAALLGLFLLSQEFYFSAKFTGKSWIHSAFHLVLFLICLLAIFPQLPYSTLVEAALLGALLGLTLITIGSSWFESENKIIASKKRSIGQKVPVLFALVLLTLSNHFGRVYTLYAFWILSIASLLLVYQLHRGKILFYRYAVFVFSLSAAFLVTLNTELSFYWMRIPQNIFLLLAFLFLQLGVVNVSKKIE